MSKKPHIVIGGGGHGAVLVDMMQLLGLSIAGIVDPGLEAGSIGPGGLKILGGDEVIFEQDPSAIKLVNGVGSVGATLVRHGVYDRFAQRGFSFATLVHPSAIVAADVELGAGVQVMAGVVLQTGVRVGANSIINTRAGLDHHCIISAHVHIAPGVTLSGNVEVGEGSHIGTGVNIKQKVVVGSNVVVGIGVAVLAAIADNTIIHPAVNPVWTKRSR